MVMFPTAGVHDDLIDALSYIDQLAVTSYQTDFEEDTHDVIDPIVGW
jgi:hypothetical protein